MVIRENENYGKQDTLAIMISLMFTPDSRYDEDKIKNKIDSILPDTIEYQFGRMNDYRNEYIINFFHNSSEKFINDFEFIYQFIEEFINDEDTNRVTDFYNTIHVHTAFISHHDQFTSFSKRDNVINKDGLKIYPGYSRISSFLSTNTSFILDSKDMDDCPYITIDDIERCDFYNTIRTFIAEEKIEIVSSDTIYLVK